MGPMSYEGPEKYIFVSYAHKDSDRVMHVLEKLVEKGYRIWYDDGIAPGSEWPEDIAEHLDGCATFMSFISNNSMDSANCRREINFALSRQKPFLGIILEPTKMTLGMEMQLSSQHCLIRENYRLEEDFLRKLFSSPDLECCKMSQEERAAFLAPVPPEEAPLPAPVKQVPAVQQKAVPAAAPEQKPKAPKKKKGKVVDGELTREKKPKSGFRRLLEGLLIVGALVGLIATGLVMGSFVEVLPDMRTSRYTTTLTVKQRQLTVDAMKKISGLEKLSTLYFYDCTIDEGALDWLENASLYSVYMENTPVSDVRFLNNCPAVYRVTLDGCGITNKAFKDADTSKVQYWNLSNNPDFSDLTLLTAEQLRTLQVENTAVSDVTPLAAAVALTDLNLNSTQVTKLDALAVLENLRVLCFRECPVTKVTTPFMSLSLQTLDCGGCGLKSLKGFENTTVLKKADLGGNRLTDISWLEKSVATLEEVYVAANELEKDDIQFLKNATAIRGLDISGIAMDNLELCQNMAELSWMRAKGCGITTVSHLAGLEKLQEVHLSDNKITSVAELPEFTQSGYSKLDLAYNQITSAAGISGKWFGVVALQGNPITYVPEEFTDMGGSLLALDYDEGMLGGKKLSFSRVYVAGCPADKQLQLEKALGYGVACVTEKVMLEMLAQNDFHYDE